MPTAFEILPAARLVARLLRKDRTRQRVAVAQSLQAFRRFATTASTLDLWQRLGNDLPGWAHSGVILPRTVDRLRASHRGLDPLITSTAEEQQAMRVRLQFILDDLYGVLITNDWATRWWRHYHHVDRLYQIDKAENVERKRRVRAVRAEQLVRAEFHPGESIPGS